MAMYFFIGLLLLELRSSLSLPAGEVQRTFRDGGTPAADRA